MRWILTNPLKAVHTHPWLAKLVRFGATRTETVRLEERGGRRWVSKVQNWCQQVRWRISFSKNRATWFDWLKAKSTSNPMKTYWFSLRSPHFRTYPATIYWVSLKYGTDLVSFSQIQRKFGNFLLKSGKNMVLFCSDRVVLLKSSEDPAKKTSSCHQFEPPAAYFQLRPTRLPTNQVWSDLTCGFLQSEAGLLVGNPMSSGRSRVGHKPNPDQLVDTSKSTTRLHLFFYMFHICKISRKLKINSNVINKLFKLQVFVI